MNQGKEIYSCCAPLLQKTRDCFVQKIIKVGAKMKDMNEEFDVDCFLKQFIPDSEVLKDKIEKKHQKSQTNVDKSNVAEDTCLDSDLINALKCEWESFEKEFDELLQDLDSTDHCKPPQLAKKLRKTKKKNSRSECPDVASLCLQQVLNPGELSKIFVQQKGMDEVRSFEDKPNFDDNLETIYIYRSKQA